MPSLLRSLATPIALGALALIAASGARAESFTVTNLVTDDASANPAPLVDPQLVNPWGVSYGPTSPFWVSDNGTGVSTLYTVDPTTNATSKNGLVVSIPGEGNVTGQVFNSAGSSQFSGDLFLFGSEDGTISGWQPSLGTSAAVRHLGNGESYKGLALSGSGSSALLYGANFASGKVDVYDVSFMPTLNGSFLDPNLPSGYAPFNVQNLGGTIFVTYALVGPTGDDVAGPGIGIVDAFNPQGVLQRRVATGGVLNSPWGLAIAPGTFGSLAGSLLVGNFGDGRIHAFDPTTGTELATLTDGLGNPIAIDGLWSLTPGNGAAAGSPGSIYFTAGPDDESHGLFGVIAVVPEPGTLALLGSAVFGLACARRRRPSEAAMPSRRRSL